MIGDVPSFCEGCRFWTDKKGCIEKAQKTGIEGCYSPDVFKRIKDMKVKVD